MKVKLYKHPMRGKGPTWEGDLSPDDQRTFGDIKQILKEHEPPPKDAELDIVEEKPAPPVKVPKPVPHKIRGTDFRQMRDKYIRPGDYMTDEE